MTWQAVLSAVLASSVFVGMAGAYRQAPQQPFAVLTLTDGDEYQWHIHIMGDATGLCGRKEKALRAFIPSIPPPWWAWRIEDSGCK